MYIASIGNDYYVETNKVENQPMVAIWTHKNNGNIFLSIDGWLRLIENIDSISKLIGQKDEKFLLTDYGVFIETHKECEKATIRVYFSQEDSSLIPSSRFMIQLNKDQLRKLFEVNDDLHNMFPAIMSEVQTSLTDDEKE